MKANIAGNEIVIGKRVTAGAAIMGIASGLAHLYPDYAPAIVSWATPVVFIVQILIARYGGITQ